MTEASDAEATPALIAPPIVEVVMGVKFSPIIAFDTLHHGLYWSTIRGHFPKTEVHPVLTEPTTRIMSPIPQQRTWFVSADGSYVIQVQLDRFLVNWRRRNGTYPGFAGDDGVFARFQLEFDRFQLFLRDALRSAPVIEEIELAKVDIVAPGHWANPTDLLLMLPRLSSVLDGQGVDGREIHVATNAPIQGGTLQSIVRTLPKGPRIQTEFRVRAKVGAGESVIGCFERANVHANDAFFAEFPDAETRFGSALQ